MSSSKHQVKDKAQIYVVVSYSIHSYNVYINTSSELTRTNFPRPCSFKAMLITPRSKVKDA